MLELEALLEAGNAPPRQHRRYQEINERIKAHTTEYQEGRMDLNSFIKKVGYNLCIGQ